MATIGVSKPYYAVYSNIGSTVSYASGGATLLDLVQSGCWASVGLCGLVGAIYASGEDRKDLPLFKIPADGQ